MAAEVEFYLAGPLDVPDHYFLDESLRVFNECEIRGFAIKEDRGYRQFEIVTPIYNDPQRLIQHYRGAIDLLRSIAERFERSVLLVAKPFVQQPPSGLHVHLGLLNQCGFNVLQKAGPFIQEESPHMMRVVGGLLDTLPEAMLHFVPGEDDYLRFSSLDESDRLFTPTHYCWGGNNRSCALRIPTSSRAPSSRHIEHRIPSCGANISAVVGAILAGSHYGLSHDILPASPKLYGNAFDPQLTLQKLPSSLVEAKRIAEESTALRAYNCELASRP